ncbi:peptide-methionine (R)-S-oxide reductase MsrB [Nesterenkonia sp.]|uniref:peptide-methionine (R)-S-oxide reductase MsrB n=1 Tax=Nesterenkonia sp. TaxID=704201 RepID=UPI002622C956|nr:peptide-methionine (R)-S-oxide reductase MsrB [Nesterenkonia sp.]
MSDDPFRNRLTDLEYHVLREGGTERPYTGEYWDNKEPGTYFCRACGAELFDSETKFDSRCGWPSFYQPAEGSNVTYLKDTSMGMQRIEVRCGSCDSHLGHVFEGEGFNTPTDLRYCINSVSMTFQPAGSAEQDG